MPDIAPVAPPTVNGPPMPGALAPIQGPPLPSNLAPVQGPPVPVQAADVSPQVLGNTSQNPPGTPTPVGSADPMAVSKTAINDAQAAQADEQKAAKAEAEAQQKKNEADAALADKQAEDIRKRQADVDAQQQASEQARARLVALSQQADADVGSFRFTDYKDTIPIGRKIGLVIGAALSGLGGDRDPLAQINNLTAQHFEKEKAELSSKENLAKYRRGGVEDFDRHVNDQRMALEFKERNYREAMAKETEAQGLRSGSPVAAAKAQQLAAKIRADGDAKLSGMAEQYTKGEEARARAAQFKAKARAAGGAGSAKATVEEQLAQAAADGKPYPELVKLAIKFGAKDPRKAAKDSMEGAKLDEATILRDPDTNEPLGRVPNGRNVMKVSEDLANTRKYQRLGEELASDIEKNGRILNPYSEEGKARLSLVSEFQALGRQVSGIQASDSGQKLEHEMIGGSGVGMSGIANPKAIRKLVGEAAKSTEEKLKIGLTPLPGRGMREAPAASAPAAKTTSVAMPDGSVQVFDASGKRIK